MADQGPSHSPMAREKLKAAEHSQVFQAADTNDDSHSLKCGSLREVVHHAWMEGSGRTALQAHSSWRLQHCFLCCRRSQTQTLKSSLEPVEDKYLADILVPVVAAAMVHEPWQSRTGEVYDHVRCSKGLARKRTYMTPESAVRSICGSLVCITVRTHVRAAAKAVQDRRQKILRACAA